MIMKMNEAVSFILDRPQPTTGHSLEKIRLLMEAIGNPQNKIRTIHIAGTNGKGSTSKMLYSALSKTQKTGIFNSPHIRRINEAIAINNTEISDEDFIDLVERLKPHIEDLDSKGYILTYFEILTGIMYMYFYEKKVDLAIIETGLGGLMDSTNIIKHPLASVITTISMDHMNVLGDTIEEIAFQKAGIIKDQSPVFIYPAAANVMEVFYEKVMTSHSELHTYSKDEINIEKSDDNGSVFNFRSYKDVEISLIGDHQVYNAALALIVLDYFKDQFGLNQELIKESLAEANNVGRLTTISTSPRVVVDGSHNKEAIDAMIAALHNFAYDRLIIGFSVLSDKDYAYIIHRLAEVADELVVTSLDNKRAFEFHDLENITKEIRPDAIAIEDRIKAYDYTKTLAGPKDLVLWCGSLYLISEFVNYEGF